MRNITACILAKNASATIAATLDSLKNFSEVIVLDNGSTDTTCDIAKNYPNTTLHHCAFIGFGPLRNKAAEIASNDWILAIDADESLSPALCKELENIRLDATTVYGFKFHNYFQGVRIRHSGWSPDIHYRLYNKKHVRYDDKQLHEGLLLTTEKKALLSAHILHTSYRTIDDFVQKLARYSTLFAKEHAGKKRSSMGHALWHGAFAFIRTYFLQCGFLDGKWGFLIAYYNSNVAFYKYLKLWEANALLSDVSSR